MPEMASDQDFEKLLEALMSPDNAVRTQNEETYDGIQPHEKIPLLIQAMMKQDGKIESRTMAAVLLRRLFTSTFDEFWKEFDENVQNQIKQQMLLCVQHEQNPAIRKKICECTAEFARNMIDEDGNMTWREILQFLFEGGNSTDPALKESSLVIFSIVPSMFGNQQNQYLEIIKQMLANSLNDQVNANVRFAAVKATCSFILINDQQTQVLNHFKDLLDKVLVGVEESVQVQEDDSLLKSLIEIAETTPKFLRPQVDKLMQLCIKLLADHNIPDNWRQLALEVLVSLAENAPAMVRKFGTRYMSVLTQEILKMMVEIEEEDDWSLQDEVEDEDNDSNAIAGESALDRLACALAGKAMLPHILSHVPGMLKNPDWKYRHAALMAISACGEGCHKQMETMLDSIVEAVLPHLADSHPRVRYASCNALGQLSTDFGPIFQKKYHDKVVSGLVMVMDDNDNPRVQAHAGAALVNFSEDCPKSILLPYLDMIMGKLDQVLQAKFRDLIEKGQKLVLEQVVTTLASVADTAEDRFVNYYDRFMPNLKYIVANANREDLRMLRGKTIECVSLIGLAVGKEKFMQDSREVMDLLLKTQTEWSDLPDDDPQLSYMISAWARMCKIMGSEFTQYLPLVMPPILKAANIKPEVALVDSEDQKVLETDTDWQFVTLGDQQSFGIKTAGLEEKATACQMLVCYARELKEGFAPYAEDVASIMVSHLKFYFHDGVRVAAAESLPYLLECAKVKGPEYTGQMWQKVILPQLLAAIDTEPEADIKAEHMHSMAQCIEKMGPGCLQDPEMLHLVSILEKVLKTHFDKQASRLEKRKEEDYDEDVEESLLEEDDEDVYILSKVSDILHSLFGTYKTAFLPYFDKLLPGFVNLLGSNRPWADRQWSLCIFDDLIEHAGPASFNYESYFLQNLIHYVCDKQPEVRQAATYGIGVMAMYGGQDFATTLKGVLPLLLQVIQDPESRQPENVNPTENAISALTKICKYMPSVVNLDEVLPFWLSCLPVWEDEDEAVHIYNYLCDLIQANHPLILQQLPRIVAIIAEAFHKESVPSVSEVAKRMVHIVQQIQQNQEVFQTCISQLNPEQQTSLSKAVTQVVS